MSPLLEPPAARPHATDPAPCLNRCSINNACFSATHLPGGQIGKRRVDEREREWVNESVWREDKREGEWARAQKLEWLLGDGLATPGEAKGPVNLRMKCPPCPICSRRAGERKVYIVWAHLFKSSNIIFLFTAFSLQLFIEYAAYFRAVNAALGFTLYSTCVHSASYLFDELTLFWPLRSWGGMRWSAVLCSCSVFPKKKHFFLFSFSALWYGLW